MPRKRHPRRGSMQFWPRKRSRHSLARIRSWSSESKAKPLAFIGYKAGMTHLQVTDNRPKALTKGETIFLPATIVDCPPMFVMGVVFYKNTFDGLKKSATILAEKLNKELSQKLPLPKKPAKKFDEINDFDDLRLLVHSQPKLTTTGTKKPKLIEVFLGGSKEEKLAYARDILGKEINAKDVFAAGNAVDVHGITKGKGFQGTVKRYGVPLRQHKAEKTKRGIATLGPWTPKRIAFSIPQPGKMGYHQRTEYNKQILKISQEGKEVNPKGGIKNYGLIRSHYLLLKGSVLGPKKRAVLLTQAIRVNPQMTKEAPEITYLSTK